MQRVAGRQLVQAHEIDVAELYGEPAGEQLACRPERQRRRLDHDQIVGIDEPCQVDRQFARAGGGDHEDWKTGEQSNREAQRAGGRMIEPVQIVEDDDERPGLGE